MPKLDIHLDRIKYNLEKLLEISKENSLELMPIVKAFAGVSDILDIFDDARIQNMGISRLNTLTKLNAFENKISLTCISLLEKEKQERAFLEFDEIYISSEESLKNYIDLAKTYPQKKQCLVLLLDCGDHREGLFAQDLLELVKSSHQELPANLELSGVATTLGCNFGVLPNPENLALLKSVVENMEQILSKKLATVSVGGSIILKTILDGELPSFIKQIRIGEALLLGTIPAYSMDHPSLNQNAFLFQSTLLELSEKPNFPSHKQGLDALGNQNSVQKKKVILQGILNFGILDTDMTGLKVNNAKLKFCNQNSDYTMVELLEYPEDSAKVFSFSLNYKSLVQALCSEFVEKRFI
ncbi:alanine racemase [bacterium]|nr:alanine racemase [bacterium]